MSSNSSNRRSNGSTSKASTSSGCWGRISAEVTHPLFVVREVDGRVIDIPASFAPQPAMLARIVKMLILGWIFQIVWFDLADEQSPETAAIAWAIYLTSWAFLIATFYFIMSFSLSCCCVPTQPSGGGDARPTFSVRLTWGLFSTAAVLQMGVTLLFWILEYPAMESGPSYTMIMSHGGIMVLVLMEGLLLNRVPVRMKHMLFVWTVSFVYLIWTFIHAQLGIGNPQNDEDEIYAAINWKETPKLSAGVTAMVCFLVVPLLFLVLWAMSLCRRAYLDGSAPTGGRSGSGRRTSDVESGAHYHRMRK